MEIIFGGLLVLAGVILGHVLTMRAISHIQPSMKEVNTVLAQARPQKEIEIEQVVPGINTRDEIIADIERITGKKAEDMYGVAK